MKRKVLLSLMILLLTFGSMSLFAGGVKEEEEQIVSTDEMDQPLTIEMVAEQLDITVDRLKEALGGPGQGSVDFTEAAGSLGVSAELLESLMKQVEQQEVSVEVSEHTIVLNGISFDITFEVFSWDELPSDVVYEREELEEYTDTDGITHYYEVIYVESGNLNWYQAAYLAEVSGGYLACPTTEGENEFIFSLVKDEKFFWHFDENGAHYGISIGPFLGGYQPDGSVEPDGGWQWLSGETWDYTNWAQNLDDGVTDKDPRDNTQPNDSGDGQPIMGFGEMNTPVSTWGDYMESVGTYGLTRSPGQSYGFIIEYENMPE
ncbi:MAG: hypothetical protein ACPKOP_06660 [Sphaerochaetaceae bacterium]